MKDFDDSYDYGYDADEIGDESSAGGGFLFGALSGAVVAAALVYLLDPQAGQERRERVRDRAQSLYRRGRDGIGGLRERAGSRAEELVDEGRERADELRGRAEQVRGRARGVYEDTRRHAREALDDTRRHARAAYDDVRDSIDGDSARGLASGAAGLGLTGWGLSKRGPLGIALGAIGLYLLVTTLRRSGAGEWLSETIDEARESLRSTADDALGGSTSGASDMGMQSAGASPGTGTPGSTH